MTISRLMNCKGSKLQEVEVTRSVRVDESRAPRLCAVLPTRQLPVHPVGVAPRLEIPTLFSGLKRSLISVSH